MILPNLIIEKNCLSERKFSEIMVEIEEHKEEFVPYESDFLKYDRWYPKLTNRIVSMIDLFLYSSELKEKASRYRDHCWRIFTSDSISKFEVDVTKYHPEKNHKYDWHVDHLRIDGMSGRILNYVLYLNDNFKGGELQLSDELISNTPPRDVKYNISQTIKPERNMLVIMPAWTIHRVLPVTSGEPRLTLNGHIQ